MAMDNTLVVAYLAADNLEANLLRGLLEAQGVKVQLSGELLQGGGGELPLAEGVRLWVQARQLALAQQLLHAYESEEGDHDWRCLECHEINGAAFDLCWQCGAPKP